MSRFSCGEFSFGANFVRASLADSLKAMDHSTYLLLSTQMFGTMLSRLQRAQSMGAIIQDITGALKSVSRLLLSLVNADNIVVYLAYISHL